MIAMFCTWLPNAPPPPPACPLKGGAPHIICQAAHAWQATAIHEWMYLRYYTMWDAHYAVWSLETWQWQLERIPPWYSMFVLLPRS